MARLRLAEEFEAKTHDDWLSLVAKSLQDRDFETHLTSRSADGIRIAPLYTGKDMPSEALRALRTDSSDGVWDVRTLHADADAARMNAAILDDLSGGATSIAIQLEAPGQFGLLAKRVALERALVDVRLDAISVAFTPGEAYRDAAETLSELWIAQSVDKDQRAGAINADPLGILAASGALSHDIKDAVQDAASLAGEQRWATPGITVLAADGRPFHEAGASEAQELACLLSATVLYLRAMDGQGCEPDAAWPRIAFHLAADADLFLTMAKLRAARRLLMRIGKACRVEVPQQRTSLSVQTSARMMSRRDPWVNMLRTTVACTGASLGGADAITVLPYTWAIGRPDGFARRIARNTQLVLQAESALGRVADPAGGAWGIEALTDELAQAAWTLFQDIEAEGGLAEALAEGMIQDQIDETAARRSDDIAHGRQDLTGVSAFPQLVETPIEAEPHPFAGAALTSPACTVKPLAPTRLAAPIELLRDGADAYAARTGSAPSVFLANLGDLSSFGPRATYARNFFAAGGIVTVGEDGFGTAAILAEAFKKSGAKLACICGSDADYAEHAAAAAEALRGASAGYVYLAGKGGDLTETLKAAGVGTFIHIGCDALDILREAHQRLGIAEVVPAGERDESA